MTTTNNATPYRYFVSYIYSIANGFGSGNTEIHLRLPIRSFADIKVITDLLIKQGLPNPVIMSFCLFDSAVPTPARPAPSQATS
jgi:hypothetical protein